MQTENILNNIYSQKRKEVEERKSLYPEKLLKKSLYYPTSPVSLSEYIMRKDKQGIIAEFKTQSPSKGTINADADAGRVTLGYMQSGASALSILTDRTFFGGLLDHLTKARKENFCPILQKDFILDRYQIIEAKAYGADAILLIAAMLTKEEIKDLASFASFLGMEVLLEIHDVEELYKINEKVDLIGVNNRDLHNFKINHNNSVKLVNQIPGEFIKIAESGIETPSQANDLLNSGFDGLLIGGAFMKEERPDKACKRFISKLQSLQNNDLLEHQLTTDFTCKYND